MEQLTAPSWMPPFPSSSCIIKGLVPPNPTSLHPLQRLRHIMSSAYMSIPCASSSSRSCGSTVQMLPKDQLVIHIEESANHGLVLFKFGSPYPRRMCSASLNPMAGCVSLMQQRDPISFEASNPFSEVIDCEEYSIASMLQEEIGTTPEYPKWTATHNKNTRSAPALRDDHIMAISLETVFPHPLTLDQNQFLGTSPDFRYTFKVETDRFLPGMSGIGSHIPFPDSVFCGCDDILTLDCLHHGSMHDIEMQIEQFLTPNVTLLKENVHAKDFGAKAVSSMKSSTVRRFEKSTSRKEKMKDKGRTNKMKSRKVPDRDLFKSSSVQLYELVFVYPFLDSNNAVLNWKTLPKEKCGELFDVLNRVAVGVGGTGLALVLLGVSRMLCLNATLDNTKLAYLLRGMGLIWLSSGLKKFGSIVKHMADFCIKTRLERKEQLIKYKEEVQAISFRVCLLVVLTMVG